jgi:hypothetical protein
MNIAIIGKGTSAIIQALMFIRYGHRVTIFYDSSIPEICVGESTTPLVMNLVQNVCKISIGDMLDDGIVSLKNGIKFINWGNQDSFRHHFFSNTPLAAHFLTKKFNLYIHNILKNYGVEYIDVNVDNVIEDDDGVIICDRKFDFVTHCTGWDGLNLQYRKAIFETVNSALVYNDDYIEDYSYTVHRAHENGWQFELPFPEQNLSRQGYLFNRNYQSLNEAKFLVNKKDMKYLEWEQRFSKKFILTKRQSVNGNCLFFIEPLQALSLHYYVIFAEMICSYLNDMNLQKYNEMNKDYLEKIIAYQNLIAFHYSYGSKFKSNFWKDTQNNAKLIVQKLAIQGDTLTYEDYIRNDIFYGTEYSKLGCFTSEDHMYIHCGMMNKSKKDILNINA